MGLFGRLRRGASRARNEDEAHLRAWAAAHAGVEAFVEPRTTVTETTVLLVDKDGAWTRRRVRDPAAARKFARSLAMPVYDVQLVGYPQRMPVTLAMSATRESSSPRMWSGSGIAQPSSPVARACAATRSRKSSLPMTPAVRSPSATCWAPVSVDVSTR